MTFDGFFWIFWVCWLSPTWYNIDCSINVWIWSLSTSTINWSTQLWNIIHQETSSTKLFFFFFFLAVLSLHCSVQASLVGNCQFSCPEACNILLSWPEIKLVTPALKGRLLGPPGKFPDGFSFESSLLSLKSWGTHTHKRKEGESKAQNVKHN